MRRTPTIKLADDVYQGLHHEVGRGDISRFIEGFLRPHVVADGELEAEYHRMAAVETREREALEWIEAIPDEALE